MPRDKLCYISLNVLVNLGKSQYLGEKRRTGFADVGSLKLTTVGLFNLLAECELLLIMK